MFRGFFIYILLCANLAHAEDFTSPEAQFARAENIQEDRVRTQSAFAPREDASPVQYVNVPSGSSLAIHFVRPQDSRQIIFIFVGGLDADIETFTQVENILLPLGYGSLRIELNGQGTLVAKNSEPSPIPLELQSQDLVSAITQLKIDPSKISLVGESYGADVVLQAMVDLARAGAPPIHSVNLLNPMMAGVSAADASIFAPIYMRLKNIQGAGPASSENIRDLLVYLSARGEYASQTEESFDLDQVTSAFDLFMGVGPGLLENLAVVRAKVNVLDGMSDLVIPSADKSDLFEKLAPASRGIYFRAQGIGHRAAEDSPADVAEFLTRLSNP